MSERACMVYPAIYVPAALSVLAVVLALFVSLWSLAALPFIWLGAVCSTPSMNLIDGCLSYLSIIAGLVILIFVSKPLGIAIAAGAISGFYGCVVEKVLRMRPLPDDA